MVGIGVVVAVDVRARDLQDWSVQVAHFVLNSGIDGVVELMLDGVVIKQMIVWIMMILN